MPRVPREAIEGEDSGVGPAMARAMYARVLQQWAMDALSLRKRGLDRPGLRVAFSAAPVRPRRASDTHQGRSAA